MTARRDLRPLLADPDSPPALRGDEGAVAARCFHLAGQMRGGPVRDALLAMGRDYAARARDGARLAGRAVTVGGGPPPAATLLGRLLAVVTDFVAPLPPRAAPSSPVVAAPPATDTAITGTPASPAAGTSAPPEPAAPRRRSRLFRINRPD